MDVFTLRERVVRDYRNYVQSFVTIKDPRIAEFVHRELDNGVLWPDPLVQLNPAFEPGDGLARLVENGELHPECLRIFADKAPDGRIVAPYRLHKHQVEAIRAARAGKNYVLTTGTGSGKSLAYIVPIVDHVLRRGSGKGIQAIVVYPMNALANSQIGELQKFLHPGFAKPPVTFRRYTGQESDDERKAIIADPPDILLTNYVMLELVLTRPWDHQLVEAARGLRFLVLDELHTYRGRQGADVALLVRRVRDACEGTHLLHVGTSATLASEGTWDEQRSKVAEVASRLFGAPVETDQVIGETLRRTTPWRDPADVAFQAALRARLQPGHLVPTNAAGFAEDPLASWIETVLGLDHEPGTARLVRSLPRPLAGPAGAAAALSEQAGAPVERCDAALREMLLGGYQCRDEHGRPVFAFRLHQFVAKGESVYCSPEPEDRRHITLVRQQFVPGADRSRVLLPIAFCRECGQEYYVVRRGESDDGQPCYLPREVSDRLDNDDSTAGFLFLSSKEPWPDEPEGYVGRLPDAWVEPVGEILRVRKTMRGYLPVKVFLDGLAVEGGGDQVAWWVDAPFRFCLACGVAYSPRQSSDFGKLATLGSEGRSTATTILTLSSIRSLRSDADLAPKARKLLSFTDNRQDASLQAGHFNDFVEVALLRSAIWRAVEAAGAEGISHDRLTQRVFAALDLPLVVYAADPGVKYAAREETDRALREVLGYYLYRDLRRGWRVTSPNLEQSGLLQIDYLSLGDVCADAEAWETSHPALANANAEDRERVSRVLLDYLRRELAIRVSYLDPLEHERIRQLSAQRLVAPWSLDDSELLERSRIILPRSRGEDAGDRGTLVFLAPRGGFGLYLKRPGTFSHLHEPLKVDDVADIIPGLLAVLAEPGGIVHKTLAPREDGDVPGYQLNAAAMIWHRGDGESAFHDPVRVPRAPTGGLRTNPFFKGLYRGSSADLKALEAREHTAQVPAEVREEREERFRGGRLPILYCSPTMELGVDIAELNVVNMRNIPPTPANYAQRSGRAGRSGQPAFVFSYCSAGSPHDQYFFKRPEKMVKGSVAPPRLDLGNEDLLRAHVHAVWLAESGQSLGSSLQEVLDLAGDQPTLDVLPKVVEALHDLASRGRAAHTARRALTEAIQEMLTPEAEPGAWIDRVLAQIPKAFDEACDRWRGLYRSALEQSKRQQRIILDPSRDPSDRDNAKRLRAEAEAQLRLLIEATARQQQSDFYSYRYFASEGFLPGYNFPRLPLSAFLPGRRRAKGTDEFLTRPRFLAISEFGPRSIIYHEGSRYVVNKVILPVEATEGGLTRRAAQCGTCGYLHPLEDAPAPDLCESCAARLGPAMDNLFRMQNAATRRRDRINSDEEERFRLGYELRTGVRFARREGMLSARQAEVVDAHGGAMGTLVYGHSATLWRMNLGWRRRKNKEDVGFVLDVERGYWAKSQMVTEDDPEDPVSQRTKRVVPYVEDTRNCVVFRPATLLDGDTMASFEAVFKAAIQVEFQLEDRELSSEPLPGSEDRRQLLLYEASEGGAGVLRRLVEDAAVLPRVARTALELAHFDPETGVDRGGALGAKEPCEAACYDCLLSYFNQRDHRRLDRKKVRDLLLALRDATLVSSAGPGPREGHVDRLLRLCQSDLERRWLRLIDGTGLKLPSDGQKLLEDVSVRPDFLYTAERAAIFVDGPVHDDPDQQRVDAEHQDRLEDSGWWVLRFHHADDWRALVARYPSLFGKPISEPSENV